MEQQEIEKDKKIGVDIDGVLTVEKNVDFFNVQRQICEIHIITARPESDIEMTVEEMGERGVEFDSINFFNSNAERLEMVMRDDRDQRIRLWDCPEPFNACKARVVRELGLEEMYDDMPEFLEPMDEKVKCYQVKGSRYIPFVPRQMTLYERQMGIVNPFEHLEKRMGVQRVRRESLFRKLWQKLFF
jgi:hypothetical protein